MQAGASAESSESQGAASDDGRDARSWLVWAMASVKRWGSWVGWSVLALWTSDWMDCSALIRASVEESAAELVILERTLVVHVMMVWRWRRGNRDKRLTTAARRSSSRLCSLPAQSVFSLLHIN